MKNGRKASGGRYIQRRKKKSYEIAGQRRIIKLGEEKKKTQRGRGGNKRILLLATKFINIFAKGKSKKVVIKNVLETPSNKFLARQNILTKGTIVETDIGKAKITNRPTQESLVNGILIE